MDRGQTEPRSLNLRQATAVRMNVPTLPSLSDAEIASLVQEFNSLPRQQTLPSGLGPNRWVFGLHVVPIPPAGYLLFILNPMARFIHGEGPLPVETRPLSGAEVRERGKKVAILLLKAFVSGLGRAQTPDRFAPWEWVAEDMELAAVVSSHLRSLGVHSELCTVGVATDQEKNIAADCFAGFLENLVRTMRGTGRGH